MHTPAWQQSTRAECAHVRQLLQALERDAAPPRLEVVQGELLQVYRQMAEATDHVETCLDARGGGRSGSPADNDVRLDAAIAKIDAGLRLLHNVEQRTTRVRQDAAQRDAGGPLAPPRHGAQTKTLLILR